MKNYTIQTQVKSKVSCSAIPLKNLIQPDDKICQLEKLVNWQYLDNKLGHLFAGDNAPPSRLILGLLYLQSIDNLPYSEIISIWKKSPEWQHFCGETMLTDTFPLNDASLSIWSRVVGDQGRESMTRALGLVRRSETLH